MLNNPLPIWFADAQMSKQKFLAPVFSSRSNCVATIHADAGFVNIEDRDEKNFLQVAIEKGCPTHWITALMNW